MRFFVCVRVLAWTWLYVCVHGARIAYYFFLLLFWYSFGVLCRSKFTVPISPSHFTFRTYFHNLFGHGKITSMEWNQTHILNYIAKGRHLIWFSFHLFACVPLIFALHWELDFLIVTRALALCSSCSICSLASAAALALALALRTCIHKVLSFVANRVHRRHINWFIFPFELVCSRFCLTATKLNANSLRGQ